MHRFALAAVLGLPLALGSAALAQSVEGRVDFRNDHSRRNTPTGSHYTVTRPGTYEFQVLFGVFDAQGFTNRGMFNFIGDISLNDPLGTSTMAPLSGGARRSPYDGNGIEYGGGSPGNSTTFDAYRGFIPGTLSGDMFVEVPWAYGQPMPSTMDVFYPAYDRRTPGTGNGLDEYFPGYRFTVTVPELASRTITIDLSATTQAVSMFFPLEMVPPTPTSEGSVKFMPGMFVADNNVQAVLTIDVVTPIPAPGSAALIALGVVCARRRRRSPG